MPPSSRGLALQATRRSSAASSDNTDWGLQSYPRPGPGPGHPRSGTGASNYTNGLTGFVTKKPTTTVEYDPGLPFGTLADLREREPVRASHQTRRDVHGDRQHARRAAAATTRARPRRHRDPPSDRAPCPTSATSGLAGRAMSRPSARRGRLHAARAARHDLDEHDRHARRVRAARHRDQAHGGDAGARRGHAARPPGAGPDDAPAALAGLPQRDRARRIVEAQPTLGDVLRRPQRRHRAARRSGSRSACSPTTRPQQQIVESTRTRHRPATTPIDVHRRRPTRTRRPARERRARQGGGRHADTIFRYYAFSAATPPEPERRAGQPRRAADLGRIAPGRPRLRRRVPARRPARQAPRGSIELRDQVYIRAADPNDPAPYPTCA